MARFLIVKHVKRQPLWLLEVLATFPYDRKASYPDEEKSTMLCVVLSYLQDFKYKRRNSWEQLGKTHSFTTTDSSILVSTCNGVPQLSISLS